LGLDNRCKDEIGNHSDAKDDAVDAENGEGMLADIFHQALDDDQADDEGYHTAGDQHHQLGRGGLRAIHQEL